MEHKWPVIEQQKLLALKDREIMRLREALEAVMRCEYATTEKEDYILVDDCQCLLVTIEEVRKIKQSLSTPTTYDDLMAWHEAQLGEPVACIDHIEGIKTVVWKERDYPDIGTKLYAKKG